MQVRTLRRGQGIRGLRGDDDATLHRTQLEVRALVARFYLQRDWLEPRASPVGQDLLDEVIRVFHTGVLNPLRIPDIAQ